MIDHGMEMEHFELSNSLMNAPMKEMSQIEGSSVDASWLSMFMHQYVRLAKCP